MVATSLRRVVAASGRCPVAPPANPTEEEAREWAETLRSHYATQQQSFLTIDALMLFARTAELRLALQNVYYDEYEASRAGRGLLVRYRGEAPARPVAAGAQAQPADGQPTKGKRYDLFGFPVTAVLRWMGQDAWTYEQSKKALDALGIAVADATIRAQLLAGRKGERGAPAAITAGQEAELNRVAGLAGA